MFVLKRFGIRFVQSLLKYLICSGLFVQSKSIFQSD